MKYTIDDLDIVLLHVATIKSIHILNIQYSCRSEPFKDIESRE